MGYFKALETSYKGYKFRSRWEARWAVYFDEMGIEYMFEPEGYVLNDGSTYLPDFYLPDFVCFAEVKGGPFMRAKDINKAERLVKDTLFPLVVLDGEPDFDHYEMILPEDDGEEYTVKMVNMRQDPGRNSGKFITEQYLSSEEDFEERGFTDVIDAVYAARGERFGT